MQFKPISTSTVEIAVKKANLKSDKLVEIERILAALKMGVRTLVERLAGVNMISPELRDLLHKGSPSIDIDDDDCCAALDLFTQTIESILDSLDESMYPLGISPARRSPSNRSPALEKRGSVPGIPSLIARSTSTSQGGFNADMLGCESPGKLNRRFSLSSR
jgi:hypothetical protein